MMEAVQFQALLEAPPPVTLYAANNKKMALVTLVLIALALNGVYMALHPSAGGSAFTGWAIATLFGLLAVYFLANSLLPKKSVSLTLEADRFALKIFRRTLTYAWKDVSAFSAATAGSPSAFKALDTVNAVRGTDQPVYSTNDMVGKQVLFNSGAQGMAAQFMRNSTGYDSAIPLMAGVDAGQLATLMNRWRERALAAK